MCSAVSDQKRDAIVAFFNLFSDKLRLEECKNILEVGYLLNTVVHFILSGRLQYHDHSSFGFFHTVDFLREQLQPCFYTILDPKAAEQGDNVECLKIFVAVMYSFWQLKKALFKNWVNFLPIEINMQIAEMVEYLDFPDEWTSPEAWPEILSMPPIDSFGTSSRRESCLNEEEVRAMNDRLLGYRKQLEEADFEVSMRESETEKLRLDLEILAKKNECLTRKVALLLMENENVDILQSRLENLVQNNSELKSELNQSSIECDSTRAHMKQVMCERDSAVAKAENEQLEKQSAVESLKKLQQEFRDEILRHDVTREKLEALSKEYKESQSHWNTTVVKLEDHIFAQKNSFNYRFEEMNREYQSMEQEYKQCLHLISCKAVEQTDCLKKEDQPKEIEVIDRKAIEVVDQTFNEGNAPLVFETGDKPDSRRLLFLLLILLVFVVILLFLSYVSDPPLFHHGFILVPWRWHMFSLN